MESVSALTVAAEPAAPVTSGPVHEVRVRHGSMSELAAFKSDWNKLLRQSDADSIFLTYEWMEAWLDRVCPMARMTIVSVHSRDGELLGIGPFYRTGFRLLKVIPYPGLRLAGDVGAAAEYPDLIIRRGHDVPVARSLMKALMQSAPGACLWMTRMSGWSGAKERWKAAADAAGMCWQERPNYFGALELPGTIDEYLNLVSSNHRSMLRRRTRQIQKLARVELTQCTEPDQLGPMLADLFRLHEQRWQSEGRPGAFVRRRRLADFYRSFAPVALANGWLRLYSLKLDGVTQAVQYGYFYNGAYLQMQEGFNPEGPEGVGNVLRLMAIEKLINEGVRMYDFLGHYTEHKRRWGAEMRTGCDLLLGRPTLKNRVLFSKKVWPTGRFLREHHPTGCT